MSQVFLFLYLEDRHRTVEGRGPLVRELNSHLLWGLSQGSFASGHGRLVFRPWGRRQPPPLQPLSVAHCCCRRLWSSCICALHSPCLPSTLGARPTSLGAQLTPAD